MTAGQPLIEFDVAAIKAAGYDTSVVVVLQYVESDKKHNYTVIRK